MKLDLQRARAALQAFDFRKLFIEELGWANYTGKPFEIRTDDHVCKLVPIAEQGGMVIYEGQPVDNDSLAPSHVRKAVDREVAKRTFEHLIIFTDAARKRSVWLWAKRESGKPVVFREHTYHASQPGDSLLQKLDGLFFDLDELDAQGRVPIITVVQRVAKQFDVETVTKKFYQGFETEHDRFLKFLQGIQDQGHRGWYASVMLNRLMFIYFIQKKGFLDGDPDYLSNKLAASKTRGKDKFYRHFLTKLFFEGFATEEKDRSPETRQLLGKIPYLNGGIFLPHEIEKQNLNLDIPDAAFDRLFAFFNRYRWHLDDRPHRADNEINPDVLGYIFEKYINQKQMGAYYTKEDITDYICKNTIIPFLFDKLATFHPSAVNPLPIADIEPYIYPAVKHGCDKPLPPEIAAGLNPPGLRDPVPEVASIHDIPTIRLRQAWNKPAPPEYALPTEIWREVIARRQRCEAIRARFGRARPPGAPSRSDVADSGDPGGVALPTTINDFITLNLDIVAYAQDFLRNLTDPLVLRAFYFECLQKLTVLDPTCGSGAFLFAALNILEPLYELCLDKMEEFVEAASRRFPENDSEIKRQDAASTTIFFDPSEPIANLTGNLPHWRQQGATYFVTFRLADSMPQEKLQQWLDEREAWLKANPEPHAPEQRLEYHERFPARFQQWLDANYGSCVLEIPEVKTIVENALRHFDGDRYRLGEFVVMPNHVHVLVTPLGKHTLSEILHSWKSFTAKEIVKVEAASRRLNNSAIKTRDASSTAEAASRRLEGSRVWQKESFDHIVRSPDQLDRIVQYIRDNPKAVEAASRRMNDSGIKTRDASSTVEAASRRFNPVPPTKRRDAASTVGVASRRVNELRIKYKDFVEELQRVERHPNRRHFIYKNIIVNNLYGVDIMAEAVEICKLRLFLKLVAETDDPDRVEPLPDIDFNIRAGNTLVGYATLAEVQQSLFGRAVLDRIRQVDIQLRTYRNCQTEIGISATALRKNKEHIRTLLAEIEDKLDRSLFSEYGARDLAEWKRTHQPFHWYVEFNSIIQNGGFDVIVGNPPYVDYAKVRGTYTVRDYDTGPCSNLYAFVTERALKLNQRPGRTGLILMLNLTFAEGFSTLRTCLVENGRNLWVSSYDNIPDGLFAGSAKTKSENTNKVVSQRVCIVLCDAGKAQQVGFHTTHFLRWNRDYRPCLFPTISYGVGQSAKTPTWPALGSEIATSVFQKLQMSRAKALGRMLSTAGKEFLQMAATPRYFISAVPEELNRSGLIELRFSGHQDRNAAECVLNSNLFYWVWRVSGDGFHLTRTVIEGFPIPETFAAAVVEHDRLVHQLKMVRPRCQTAKLNKGMYAYNVNYNIAPEAMTAIDGVLAGHYGLSAEELDFVVNYDIKYRLGRAAGEEDAE